MSEWEEQSRTDLGPNAALKAFSHHMYATNVPIWGVIALMLCATDAPSWIHWRPVWCVTTLANTGQNTPAQAQRGRTEMTTIRVGEGWDTHALVTGRPLILGGVTIEHTHGLLGHSDADALLHAITDALLGAAGLGDIGRHFPDTDPQFKGADSVALLLEAVRRVAQAGWAVGNVDSTIVAQAPKMAPHIPAMRERIAKALGVSVDAVNIKAKTAEKMGPVGEGRAIEARAVCLLLKT
jgi:2-C-methyl-D-erythritol 2,4-cyclodiphosphate synthase